MFRKKGDLNCLLDPLSLINTNLRLGYFKDNIHIQKALEFCNIETQLLFFKTQSNKYLSIDRLGDKNQVYYQDNIIDESLLNFLTAYNDSDDYVTSAISQIQDKNLKT